MAPSKRESKPSRKKERSNGRRKKADRDLYCVCRQPWDGNSLMVQCDQCQDWFHPKCVGVSRRDAKDNPFVCPQCQDKPILKLINYKMGSYSKKMQTSYYESLAPHRLYQMYSIPHIPRTHTNDTPLKPIPFESFVQAKSLNAICQNIIHQMTANHHTSYDMEYYRKLIVFMTNKKNKIERIHCGTIHACNQYFLSCLFTKQCDLRYDMKKAKPYLISNIICDEKIKAFIHDDVISNIISKYNDENQDEMKHKDEVMRDRMAQYSMQLMDVCSIMCLNCNGQITTNDYMKHINQCYATRHVFYEQTLERPQDTSGGAVSFDHDDLLFATSYKSECVPPNPLEMDLNEESELESDALSVPDISDRKKVLKHLIQNKHKNKCLPKRRSSHEIDTASNPIYDKIYAQLLPELNQMESNQEHEEDEEDEEEEEEEDEDDDDDIPIAQNIIKMDSRSTISRGYNYNLRQRPCAAPITPKPPHFISKRQVTEDANDPFKYKKMEHKFKRYYKENKMRKLKRKQKEYQMKVKCKKNHNKNKYNARFESDKRIINQLYSVITAMAKRKHLLSMHKSKQLLNKLMQCNAHKLKLKHCGYLLDDIVSNDPNHEHNEQKTMRMELDHEDEEDSDMHQKEHRKYLYFCHEKVNSNGLCSIHNNWRAQRYTQLIAKLRDEMEQIFLLKCALKEMKKLWKNDKERHRLMHKDRQSQLEQCFKDSLVAMDDNDISSCISIKPLATQTDIDSLLQLDASIHRDTLQNIENNAVLFPNQSKIN
eukprot:210962_1